MLQGYESKNVIRLHGFCDVAWEEAQKSARLMELGQERITRFAAIWYEANEVALLRVNYGMVDQAVRQMAEELRGAGFGFADLVEMLRLLRSTAVLERWAEDQLEEVDSVIDMLLPQLGRTWEDWQVPVGYSYRDGGVHEEAVELLEEPAAAPAPAASPQGESREHTRTKLELPVRIACPEMDWGPDEITRTVNIARSGIYIHTTRPYERGMRLLVCCPYSDEPDALNRDYVSEVVRVDQTPGDSRRGVAIKFLRVNQN